METRFSILFYGKKAKMTKEGLVPIYLRVTIGGERFETSTHRYVQPEKWSVAASRVKGNSADARTINTYLDSLLGKAYIYQQELINEHQDVNIKNFAAKWSGEKLILIRMLRRRSSWS